MGRNTAGDMDKALAQQRRLPTFGRRTAHEEQVATGKPVQLAWKYEMLPEPGFKPELTEPELLHLVYRCSPAF
jgi:hypothetical protein